MDHVAHAESGEPDIVRAMPPLSGSRPHPLIVSAVALFALTASACYRVPEGKSAVDTIDFEGLPDGIEEDDVLDRIATRESSRFLGLFRGVIFEYEVFDQYALRRDLERVERYLRARGFYDAQVYAARVEEKGNKVRVTIGVRQGDPVVVDSVSINEKAPVAAEARTAMKKNIRKVLPIGALLDEDKFAESEDRAKQALTSTGHATATLTRNAEVDLAKHRARLVYTVDPGPSGTFGPVKFEGLGELPEDAVRRIFGVKEGDVYSSTELDEGRQALLKKGVFASVEVVQDLGEFARSRTVPVTVRTQPAKLRAFLAGAGVELDQLKTDGHLQLGWQNDNFLGGLRDFDIRYKPGIVLYPTRFPDLKPPTDPLYEHRLSATLKQPAFLEKWTTGVLRTEYNVYPVLLAQPTEDVLGYHELRGEVSLERTFWQKLFASPKYGFQANFPFDYIGHTNVDTLKVSLIGLTTNLDLRDSELKPHRGIYIGNEVQFAGGPLQGDATDIRVRPEVRGYIPISRRLTVALRGSVGFLFPSNYSALSQQNFETPGISRAEGLARDYQIMFFRGFFAGGPSSNRGYPLRAVGPHDTIPYLSPAGQSAVAGGCSPEDKLCYLPTGGLSLWEASAELRYTVSGPFSTALFCDASDVSPFVLSIRPDRPHLSCGTGARYDTPVGAIRFDVGYRIPGMQYPTDTASQFEVEPSKLFGVLPIAIAFGIGEAF